MFTFNSLDLRGSWANTVWKPNNLDLAIMLDVKMIYMHDIYASQCLFSCVTDSHV